LATDPAVSAAVADAHRREWAFVLAATVRVTADLDLAEECVQHAYTKALTVWGVSGIPVRPGAWLTTVAMNHAIDRLRREATMRRALPLLLDDRLEPAPGDIEAPEIADDRMRLVFTCCHPALAVPAQVALTLRLVCGLSTAEIARAFLVSEPTMAARITRAKKKIAAARIPYRTPPAVELPARIEAVLHVVHLVFTTGHTAPSGAELVRQDIVERALDLARMLRSLLPADPDVAGLLALILLTNARGVTRVTADGRLVLLRDQDRSRWDGAAIAQGDALVREALSKDATSRYALMAAIAAVHSKAQTWDDTDWDEVLGLYDLLMASWPSPVVALNRGAAIGLARGPVAGLEALETLGGEPQLAAYPYLVSARGDFLRQLGRVEEARLCYQEALMLTENLVERDFLAGRLRELDEGLAPSPG
jgi:RNA polymerase sigma-70 factor (ECF subfamily)